MPGRGLLGQKLAQAPAGPADSRHDGPDRAVHDGRDLAVAETLHEGQQHGGAIVVRQLSQRHFEVLCGERVGYVARRRSLQSVSDRVEVDRDPAVLPLVVAVDEDVSENLEHPRFQIGPLLEAVEVYVGAQVGVLDEILGVGLVPREL